MTVPGNLFVIAAPSGTGKTTLVNALVESLADITISISHTTRHKRPKETNHVHYHFVDKMAFEQMIAHHDFLEYATIFDEYYGTSKQWTEKTLANGVDVILEIDWQGHQQIKHLIPAAIGIFILPPSFKDLKTRLSLRNQDHPEMVERRLQDAREAVAHAPAFDYIIVNDDFNQAVADLQTIVKAARLVKKRQCIHLASLIDEFTRPI
jgi:guanylate kinase